MSWMQRLADELEHSTQQALAWLLSLAAAPWRDAAAAAALLADAAALQTYRWQVRLLEALLRGLISERAAALGAPVVAAPPWASHGRRPKRRHRRSSGRVSFRMRGRGPSSAAHQCADAGRREAAQRMPQDLELKGLRLLLRVRAVERALPKLEHYAQRYAQTRALARARRSRQGGPPAARTSHSPIALSQRSERAVAPETPLRVRRE
jgi:hypothetical protein